MRYYGDTGRILMQTRNCSIAALQCSMCPTAGPIVANCYPTAALLLRYSYILIRGRWPRADDSRSIASPPLRWKTKRCVLCCYVQTKTKKRWKRWDTQTDRQTPVVLAVYTDMVSHQDKEFVCVSDALHCAALCLARTATYCIRWRDRH